MTYHSARVTQNLLVFVQSFERYIIICKPHLKEGLTISKMIFSVVVCLLLGFLKGYLHYRAMVAFEQSKYLDDATFQMAKYAREDNGFIETILDKISVTAGIIADLVYYLLVALAPCIIGIYLNWRTAKELRKACKFVDTKERKGKYSRIMTMSSLFTYLLVFYFLIDLMRQFNSIYHIMDFINSSGWERLFKKFIEVNHSMYSIKSSIDSFIFAAYSVQSFFISCVLVWFKR